MSALKTEPASKSPGRPPGSTAATRGRTKKPNTGSNGAKEPRAPSPKLRSKTEGTTTGPTRRPLRPRRPDGREDLHLPGRRRKQQRRIGGADGRIQTSPAGQERRHQAGDGNQNKSGATLNGSLDPDGFATTYYFEWGKDTTYGQAIPLPPGTDVPTIAPGDQDVSVALRQPRGRARPTTTAWSAINSFGTTFGSDQAFTTPQPPSITSFNATNLTASSADLIATVNPNGYETNYWFEYGTTDQYGSRVPVPDGASDRRSEQHPQHRRADHRPG